jgi:hypothetical protein
MVRIQRRRRPANRTVEEPELPPGGDERDFARAEQAEREAADLFADAEVAAYNAAESVEAAENCAILAIRAAHRAVEAASWVVWDANRRLEFARQRVAKARTLVSAERQILEDMPFGSQPFTSQAYEYADSRQQRALQTSFEAADRAQRAASATWGSRESGSR